MSAANRSGNPRRGIIAISAFILTRGSIAGIPPTRGGGGRRLVRPGAGRPRPHQVRQPGRPFWAACRAVSYPDLPGRIPYQRGASLCVTGHFRFRAMAQEVLRTAELVLPDWNQVLLASRNVLHGARKSLPGISTALISWDFRPNARRWTTERSPGAFGGSFGGWTRVGLRPRRETPFGGRRRRAAGTLRRAGHRGTRSAFGQGHLQTRSGRWDDVVARQSRGDDGCLRSGRAGFAWA
jgi:hypothetical protein